jgi:hypothetical protein
MLDHPGRSDSLRSSSITRSNPVVLSSGAIGIISMGQAVHGTAPAIQIFCHSEAAAEESGAPQASDSDAVNWKQRNVRRADDALDGNGDAADCHAESSEASSASAGGQLSHMTRSFAAIQDGERGAATWNQRKVRKTDNALHSNGDAADCHAESSETSGASARRQLSQTTRSFAAAQDGERGAATWTSRRIRISALSGPVERPRHRGVGTRSTALESITMNLRTSPDSKQFRTQRTDSENRAQSPRERR